jgi:hypothetical protein
MFVIGYAPLSLDGGTITERRRYVTGSLIKKWLLPKVFARAGEGRNIPARA